MSFKVNMARDDVMKSTYSELATRAIENHSKDSTSAPYWIAIAGGPGSGKSTLSQAVRSKINYRVGAEISVVLPMDGFHYSRAQLRAISEKPGSPTFEELIARRG